MWFSLRSPYIQVLCPLAGHAAAGRIQAVRVNGELMPCCGKAAGAGSYWQCTKTDLVIYVEERVLSFDLSRFPNVQVLFYGT